MNKSSDVVVEGGYTPEQARAVLRDFFRYMYDSPNNGLDVHYRFMVYRSPISWEDRFTQADIANDFVVWSQQR